MKKLVLITLVIAVCLSGITAANTQKIHPVDSPLYDALVQLYISEGYALPSTTGPYSTDELLMMLHRIERTTLKEAGKGLYDYLARELDEDDPIVDFDVDINLETYLHTDTDNFTSPEDWIYSFEERKPLVKFVLETSPTDTIYGYSELPVQATRYDDSDNTNGPVSGLYGVEAFTSNVFLLHPTSDGDAGFLNLDFGMPYRAFGAFGGEGWSVQVGRERLSWGAGVSGNLVLGDHVNYHNVGRFTAYGDNFKYTFLTSFFPHPSEYYVYDANLESGTDNDAFPYGGYVNLDANQNAVMSGLSMFLAHRLEGRLFNDKVNLALTEAIMYMSEDNTLDLRVLSPATIFHNYYIRGNANSVLSLEVDYTPISHVNIYSSFLVDEFSLPGEPTAGQDGALPQAFGLLVGAKGNYPLLEGILYGSFEWVKTDPYLYLRDNGDRTQDAGEYGINYVIALREYMVGGINYQQEFLGYEYGNDAIVLNAQVGFREYGKFNASLNLFYMMHGTYDAWTLWDEEDETNGTSLATTPTEVHDPENNMDSDVSDRDSVSHTLVIGARGDYLVVDTLSVYGQLDWINITNPGNISTADELSDVQLTIGLSYKL
ncbi:MAG: hypothetical protein JXK93_05065 [Sphaerochaetaceae bacterium]|nr:hypothetical protein [Sphaerochaetaceae bacterium]